MNWIDPLGLCSASTKQNNNNSYTDDIIGNSCAGNRSIKWTRNKNGTRTIDEAIELLDELDLYERINNSVPGGLHRDAYIDLEDIKWLLVSKHSLKQGCYAQYAPNVQGASIVSMNHFFKDTTVLIRNTIIKIDDAIVDTMVHEYYELVRLKDRFLKNGGQLFPFEVQGAIEADPEKMKKIFKVKVNFHTQAHIFAAKVTADFQKLVKNKKVERL